MLDLPSRAIEPLCAMDGPENMPLLQEIGQVVGQQQVKSEDLPTHFDLLSWFNPSNSGD